MDERLKNIAVIRTDNLKLNKKVLDRLSEYGALIPGVIQCSESLKDNGVFMLNVYGEVFLGNKDTVVANQLELVKAGKFLEMFPSVSQINEETEEGKISIFNVAVEQVKNIDINKAVVDVFEKHGGHCGLGEKCYYKETNGKYFVMGEFKDILLMNSEDAFSLKYVFMTPQSFFDEFLGEQSIEVRDRMQGENHDDNLPTPEEIFGNKEPDEEKEKIYFPFAFFGVSEENGYKANIIARVFHKHGLSENFTGNSFTDPDWIYAIETNKSIQMEGRWSKYISQGYEVMTIDHYLDIHPEDQDCIPDPEKTEEEENSQMRYERTIAFRELSQEILEFLNKPFCHPHMTIIADCNQAELVEGVQCESFIKGEE